MIKKETFASIAFLKKEVYTGSMEGMRYYIKKVEEEIEATVYPQPYCYEATPEKQKTKEKFPFSNEGINQTVDWLNEQYDRNKEVWQECNI